MRALRPRRAPGVLSVERSARLCAGILKPASRRTLQHSLVAHLLKAGQDVRTLGALLGHEHVSTTQIYIHRLWRSGQGGHSPSDRLAAA